MQIEVPLGSVAFQQLGLFHPKYESLGRSWMPSFREPLFLLFDANHPDKLISYLAESLIYIPQDGAAYFLLGAAFYRKRLYVEALRCFRHMSDLKFRSPLSDIYFGLANWRQGHFDSALRFTLSALKVCDISVTGDDELLVAAHNNIAYFHYCLAYRSAFKTDNFLEQAERSIGLARLEAPKSFEVMHTKGCVEIWKASYVSAWIWLACAHQAGKCDQTARDLSRFKRTVMMRTPDIDYQTLQREIRGFLPAKSKGNHRIKRKEVVSLKALLRALLSRFHGKAMPSMR